MTFNIACAAVGAAFIALALAGEPLSRLINRRSNQHQPDRPDNDHD